MTLLLIIIVLVLLFGGMPQVSGHWHSYGYAPSGILFVILIVVVLWLLMSGRF